MGSRMQSPALRHRAIHIYERNSYIPNHKIFKCLPVQCVNGNCKPPPGVPEVLIKYYEPILETNILALIVHKLICL